MKKEITPDIQSIYQELSDREKQLINEQRSLNKDDGRFQEIAEELAEIKEERLRIFGISS